MAFKRKNAPDEEPEDITSTDAPEVYELDVEEEDRERPVFDLSSHDDLPIVVDADDDDGDDRPVFDLSSHEVQDDELVNDAESDSVAGDEPAEPEQSEQPEAPEQHEPAADEPSVDEADVADPSDELSVEDAALLDQAASDIVAEMRSDMLRAQAELVNFRTRVERDRAANRDAVIADVIRSLLPALDDLNRAEKHGDLEGSPLEIVAQKIRATFERYGLKVVGEKGEPFDPNFHEAVVQLPTPDVTVNTIADVIEPGYALGERLIRAAKVAVSVPE